MIRINDYYVSSNELNLNIFWKGVAVQQLLKCKLTALQTQPKTDTYQESQRIRGFTTMCYINRFFYLLTYSCHAHNALFLEVI